MGFLDSALALFRPATPVRIVASEARRVEVVESKVAQPDTSVVGVSGTANYSGLLLTEENANLQPTGAYGVAGSQQWGFWEHASRTNPACAMALEKVTAPLRDASYTFVAPKGKQVDSRILDALNWAFLEALEPGIEEVAASAAWGFLSSGFAVMERVWEYEPTKKLWWCRKLAERLPSSLSYQPWKQLNGELISIEQEAPGDDGSGRWVNVTLPADKALLFSWRRQGNNYRGFSAFRSVYMHVRIMEALVKVVGIKFQREGAGIPIATIPDAATKLSDVARQKLQQLLANLVVHENASAVMPAGVKLEWLFAPGSTKGAALEAYNDLMLHVLSVLQAQQMVLGVGNTGSRAVGSIHVDASRIFVQQVVRTFESAMNGVGRRRETGVVRQFVDLNFGPQEFYPRLACSIQKEELDPLSFAQGIAALAPTRLITITATDENVAREKFGLPAIDPDERAAALANVGPTPPAAILASRARRQMLKARASAQRGPWVPRRPLRASEQHTDFANIVALFDAAKDDFEREAKAEVMAMLVRAEPQITALLGSAGDVTELALDTTRLEAVIGDLLQRMRKAGAVHVRAELGKANAGRRARGSSWSSSHGGAVRFTAADPEQLDLELQTDKQLEAQKAALLRKMTGRLRSEIEAEAIDAERTDDDADAIVTRTVQRQLDTGAFRSDAGSVTTKAFNSGRNEAAKLLGGVAEVEYSAAMDSATCSPCSDMDGKTADFGSAEHDAMVPPNRDCDGGPMCRCVLIYIPDSESSDDDKEDAG